MYLLHVQNPVVIFPFSDLNLLIGSIRQQNMALETLNRDLQIMSLDEHPFTCELFLLADVSFVFGDSAICAHRYVLYNRNQKWQEIISGNNQVINLKNDLATKDSFLSLLRVIYRGEYPNNFYDLMGLLTCSANFQEDEIHKKSKQRALEFAQEASLEECFCVLQKIPQEATEWNVLRMKFADNILEANVEEINEEMVNYLVCLPVLPFSEYRLLQFLEKWCKHTSIPIQSHLEHIRFEWMKGSEFIEGVVEKGYFEPEVLLDYVKSLHYYKKNKQFPPQTSLNIQST